MQSTGALCVWLCLLCSVAAYSQQGSQTQVPQNSLANAVAPNIPGVVAGGTKVQLVKDGLQGSDGSIGLPDGSLIFWEATAGRILKVDNDGNISTFLDHVDGSNSLTFDPKGRLISVQRTPVPPKIAVIYPKGSEVVLADNFEGKLFGRPNDMVADKKGGVYFTDAGARGEQRSKSLPPAVYYIPPGGKAIKIGDGIEEPNGIQLSPDEKVLYVNDSHGEYMSAFDVRGHGAGRNRRNFVKYRVVSRGAEADGLAMDNRGRIYSINPEGVEIYSPQGQYLGTIPVPKRPQNIAFAGPGKKVLYVVGSGAVFKIQMRAQGIKGRAR
jgi:gluconolactonase